MNDSNKKYYIALTGAKKNAGDFLISSRAISLLKHIAPEFEYLVQPYWETLTDIEFVNSSEGIIILGGPGCQSRMYPNIYKLTKDLSEISIPIYIIGTGWYGKTGSNISEKFYYFTKHSKKLLNIINTSHVGISCRDYYTERILNSNGFKNVTMTGCPALYDITSIGKSFVPPKKISRVVFTPPQSLIFSNQCIKVMDFLKRKFNNAKLIVSFHRGIGVVDENTGISDAQNTQKIADYGKKNGYELLDCSYSAKSLDFYDSCDLHIGYRVHAHIYFLSKRLPSILLHEDGRGNGVTDALKSPGIDAYRFYQYLPSLPHYFHYLSRIYYKIGLKENKSIVDELDYIIDKLESTNYQCFIDISKHIDEHYKIMEQFIKKMIYNVEV